MKAWQWLLGPLVSRIYLRVAVHTSFPINFVLSRQQILIFFNQASLLLTVSLCSAGLASACPPPGPTLSTWAALSPYSLCRASAQTSTCACATSTVRERASECKAPRWSTLKIRTQESPRRRTEGIRKKAGMDYRTLVHRVRAYTVCCQKAPKFTNLLLVPFLFLP